MRTGEELSSNKVATFIGGWRAIITGYITCSLLTSIVGVPARHVSSPRVPGTFELIPLPLWRLLPSFIPLRPLRPLLFGPLLLFHLLFTLILLLLLLALLLTGPAHKDHIQLTGQIVLADQIVSIAFLRLASNDTKACASRKLSGRCGESIHAFDRRWARRVAEKTGIGWTARYGVLVSC